nr:phytoene desaturase [Oceanococcus sp. HetDA_MAG_MS8]
MRQTRPHVAVIGAGIGGLVASLELARRGYRVTVLEAAPKLGGKAHYREVQGHRIAMGPTVLTMRWIFDQIFSAAGSDFSRICQPQPCLRIARHFWDAGSPLDLYPDRDRNTAAIAAFAGRREAKAYVDFAAHTQMVYQSMRRGFLETAQPHPMRLGLQDGLGGLARLWRSRPMHRYWSVLSDFFADPRLRQLFGRYATYAGSNPFQATAALALISHVEECGVWRLQGGMPALAQALAALAKQHQAELLPNSPVTAIHGAAGHWTLERQDEPSLHVQAVIYNGELAALEQGLLGEVAQAACTAPKGPALAALTWALRARIHGQTLAHHNVFFGADYQREFEQIFSQQCLPDNPTVYLCAQQRNDQEPADSATQARTESMLLLSNAPAGSAPDLELGLERVCERLGSCGLHIHIEAMEAWSPQDYAKRFPASRGAVYGPPMHGWRSSFSRPSARSRIPGLYLCGGGVHPGPGLPMVALSGQFAAQAVDADLNQSC